MSFEGNSDTMVNLNNMLECQFLFSFFSSDVDECLANTSPCDASAVCTNTNGSYTCACKDGFTGNGTYCQGKQLFLSILQNISEEHHGFSRKPFIEKS